MLSIAMHTHFIADPPQMLASSEDGLLYLLLRRLPRVPSVGLMVLYQGLVILQALRLNYMVADLRMFPRPGYLVAMLYLIVVSMLPEWNNVTPALVANTLLIWLFVKLGRLYEPKATQTLIFNTGALATAIALVYKPLLVLLPWSFLVMAILRPFRLREWFIMLLGMLTPLYLLAALFYLTDDYVSLRQMWPWYQLHGYTHLDHLPGVLASSALLLVLLLLGLVYGQLHMGRMLIQARKTWGVLILLLLVCIPLPFVCYKVNLEAALPLAMPLAVLGTAYLAFSRRTWLSLVFCLLLMAVSIYTNYTWIWVND